MLADMRVLDATGALIPDNRGGGAPKGSSRDQRTERTYNRHGGKMDRITKANIEAFRKEQSLPAAMKLDVLFEHFVNYCVTSDSYDEEFDINDVHTGGGNDLGLDGIGIFVNGVLVSAVDEAKSLLETNGSLDVRFQFTQAKSASGFSGEQMVAFGDGVFDFFREELETPINEKIAAFRDLMTWIYEQSASFKKGRPQCELHFVTTGSWQNDQQLEIKIKQISAKLTSLNLFEDVNFRAAGASEVQASWSRSKNNVLAEFIFVNKATLSDIPGVSESYLGALPLSEFLKIVSDPDAGIRKHIFVDNVRDYQGDNPVNGEMQDSLQTTTGQDRFAVLNNGITLVARELRNVGNKFFASDFQIVNGCQTSHVLYNNRSSLKEDLQVPFKLIASLDEEVISAIATATNRQTEVTEEDLFALEGFQKDLEKFLLAFPEKQRLYYERRSRQYNSVAGIEKVRIITKQIEIRAFAAMFLNDAHRAARYYGALKNGVGSAMFHKGHKLEPYYTAAFAYYKLEYLFRNGLLPVRYKPARYHLLMAFRFLSGGLNMPALTANQMNKYANSVNAALWDDVKAMQTFDQAAEIIDEALGGAPLNGDAVKVQSFTDSVVVLLNKVLANSKP
ncbi:AIPR family protein [Curtobacterium flaccumfaciens pv. betae]|uniref:AIPR family protein n=1 Tax=Curtobacterium flaccumfaciens TaxID=2035 RepID=UPI00265B07C1|nr:AIPR family protein [Curtobacterium flaccumfaciens]MCS5511667.1 AIPR family protein [Curtobacterium flaccumfaciens pv. betae]